MKNTLKLVTAAFCMFVFSSNVQAITLDQEVKVEQSEPKQEKKCCKSKKSCNKDKKSCSKDKGDKM
ncbi:hypothetical protein [Capnocytophaga sp.]|uniref:hypothetical protein n=1 Tax=Capnocytophaga sp. TaxID=44737 RepID=UPI0026DABB50|nr:hypothetical protein [Capnocytophaga sp.]MDO5104399.1 hypothetical protein [Capnocytophaga sp.]